MNCLWRRVIRPPSLFLVFKSGISAKALHTVALRRHVNITLPNLNAYPVFYCANRCKSKKAKYDSDDEEVLDDDSSLSRDSKVVKFSTTSLRTDLMLKSALGVARNKIEQHFYQSRIRVNGKKILKKSATARIGDEIDIIKMISPNNPDHLYVSRVEIINVAVKDESIAITARRFKNLLIENYKEDPYKGQSTPETQ